MNPTGHDEVTRSSLSQSSQPGEHSTLAGQAHPAAMVAITATWTTWTETGDGELEREDQAISRNGPRCSGGMNNRSSLHGMAAS